MGHFHPKRPASNQSLLVEVSTRSESISLSGRADDGIHQDPKTASKSIFDLLPGLHVIAGGIRVPGGPSKN